MNESDHSTLRQRQEKMRYAIQQKGNNNSNNPMPLLNPDDDTLFISLAESSNIHNAKQSYIEKNQQSIIQQQLQNIELRNNHEEFDFQSKEFIDLASPQNKTFLLGSDIKLDDFNNQPCNIIHRDKINVKINLQTDKNIQLSTLKEISHQSVSEGSNINGYLSKQMLNTANLASYKKVDKQDLQNINIDITKIQKQPQTNFFKQTQFMNHLKNAKKFLNRLKSQVRSILFKNLSYKQFEILGDNSSNFDYYIYEQSIIQSQETYSNGVAIKDRRIILKSTLIKNLRDLTVVILYKISRNEKDENSVLQYFDYIVFVKYIDIPEKLKELETKLHISESTQNWLKLFKLEIFVLILAHIAGCIFLRIGLSELNYGQFCWIKKFELTQLTMQELYLMSLYYIIISMVTIGYGDIYPTTMYERAYVIIVALIATNVCAYSFSQISEIVKFEQSKKENFNQMMINLNDQMNVGGLSMTSQQRVRKFYEYHYQTRNQRMSLTEQIIDKLPSQLRSEVLLDMNKELINQIQLFKILSPKCIESISLTIKQKILIPDEILFQQNSQNDSLYYINKGFLDVFTTTKVKDEKPQEYNIGRLKNKEVFGYEGFLLGQYTSFGVRSYGTSVVSYIDKQSFMDILKQFPNDYEKISFEKDKTLYGYPGSTTLKLKCLSCCSYEHQFSQCPYLNYTKRYKPCLEKNQRAEFKRRKNRFSDYLFNLKEIKETAMMAYAVNGGSIIMDAISFLNNQSEDHDNTNTISTDSEREENVNEKDSITSSQVKNLLPQLSQTLSQQQLVNDSEDKTQLQQLTRSIEKPEDQTQRFSQKTQKSAEFSNQNQKSNDNNQIQFRNEDFKNQRKKKAQTYNQQNDNIKENQFKRFSYVNLNNKQIQFFDASPLSKRFSKTNDNLQKQKKQTIILPKQIDEEQPRKRLSKQENDIQNQKLLNQVYERRKRKATKLFEVQKQAFVDRISSQQRQSIHNSISQEEIVGNNLQDLLQQSSKKLFDQIQQQTSFKQLNNVQILSQLQLKSSESNKQIENKDLVKDCIKKRQNDFNDIFGIESQQNSITQQIFPTISSPQEISNHPYQLLIQSPLLKQQQQITDKNSYETMIRCQLNLQEIDLLIVRKRYMLLQQQNKNKFENLIEVPDNEMDIDRIHNYRHYYKSQNLNQILFKFKSLKSMDSKQRDRLSIKKTQCQKKKMIRKSVPSSKPSEKQLSNNYSNKTTTFINQNIE